jgi:formylmethanofuran dehydrogenase subunit A
MFGQTITMSGDSMSQWRNVPFARPNKSVVMDIECDAGCGVVPFRYRSRSFVNALQWAIGLELFLLVRDPWRIFLTTDHPNGAPFTTYPHLIRLLMDRSFRAEKLQELDPAAQAATTLATLTREYTMYEIAVMTRAGPARALGLADRGHLGAGAVADVVVYRDDPDRERMFATPEYVFKNGREIVHDGRIVEVTAGDTHVVKPAFDRAAIERSLAPYFDRFLTMRLDSYRISDDELCECGRGGRQVVHACSRPDKRPEARP